VRVFDNKTMRVKLTCVRVEPTRMRVVEKKNKQQQQQKLSTWLVPVDLWFMCIIMSLE
jgi:hypothetical protein